MNTIAALFYAAVTTPQRILLAQLVLVYYISVGVPALRRRGLGGWQVFQLVLDHWAENSVDCLESCADSPNEWIEASEDDLTLRMVLANLLLAGLLFSVAAHFIR